MSTSKHEQTKIPRIQTKNQQNERADASNFPPITLDSTAVIVSETSATTSTASREIKLRQKQQEQCNKYKIPLERVNNEATALTDLGYTLPQALRVIIRKGSKNTVATLINLHSILTSKQYDEFSCEDLIKIAARPGGANNLVAVRDNFAALKRLSFTPKNIIKMVSHDGGSKNLVAVKENFEALKQLKFTPENIIKMVAHDGGSNNLVAVKKNFDVLKQLKFTPENIIKMAAHDGGSNNLAAVKENFDLLEQLAFTPEDTIKIVSHDGGSRNLAAVKENCEALKLLGFTPEDIIKMVSYHGGSKNLAAVKENFKSLKQLGLTLVDIIKIASHHGGSNNLIAVIENFEALKQLGFTPENIIRMVSYTSGSKNLAAVKENFETLTLLGFTPENIISMVAHNSGAINLLAIKNCYELIKESALKTNQWVNHIKYEDRLVIIEVKHDYSVEQVYTILDYCYTKNAAMRSWCQPVRLSTALSIGLILRSNTDFISEETTLSTLNFLLDISKYTFQANSGTFLAQLKYTQSMTPNAAIVTFDKLCLTFEKEYSSIRQKLKSLFADFFIGLVKEQFNPPNQTKKYESFELKKLSHSVFINNYSAFNAFYSELQLELTPKKAVHSNLSSQSIDSTHLMQNLLQQSNSSNQSYKRTAAVHEGEPSSIRQRLGEPSEPIQYLEIQQRINSSQKSATEEAFFIDLEEFPSRNTVWNNEKLQSFTFFNPTEPFLPANNTIEVIMDDEETNNFLDSIFQHN